MLSDEIELDDEFFETVSITRDKSQSLKRGSQRQTTVLVSVESKPEETPNPKKYNTDKRVKFIKMKGVNSLKMETITPLVKKTVEFGTKIKSDGSTSYNELKENYLHEKKVIEKKEMNKILPWVHKAISNAKRLFLDVHHRIDDGFLQNYLNEFCFKFNRRYFKNIFERLLVAAVSYRWNYLGERYG